MDDLKEVFSGKRFKVMMTLEVYEQFQSAETDRRARILKWMKFYADDGHELLDNDKFRYEGKFSTSDKSGTKVSIYAFKAWQTRVYGGLVKSAIFVCTEIDLSKKRDLADQKLLKAAAKKLSKYNK
ncbi:hypothetical protein G6L00_03055 [Agrobacterium rhizogenes]|nr:hypothetical protein [Rhizobium rhizogenes]NTI99289.1 hypothetical protein [Rhizobium rhizogenes]